MTGSRSAPGSCAGRRRSCAVGPGARPTPRICTMQPCRQRHGELLHDVHGTGDIVVGQLSWLKPVTSAVNPSEATRIPGAHDRFSIVAGTGRSSGPGRPAPLGTRARTSASPETPGPTRMTMSSGGRCCSRARVGQETAQPCVSGRVDHIAPCAPRGWQSEHHRRTPGAARRRGRGRGSAATLSSTRPPMWPSRGGLGHARSRWSPLPCPCARRLAS